MVVVFFKLLFGGDVGFKGQKVVLFYEDSFCGMDSGELVWKMLEKDGVKFVIEFFYNCVECNFVLVMKKVQEVLLMILVWVGYIEDVVVGIKVMQQFDFIFYVVGIGGGLGDFWLLELVDFKFIEWLRVFNIDYFSFDLKCVVYLME